MLDFDQISPTEKAFMGAMFGSVIVFSLYVLRKVFMRFRHQSSAVRLRAADEFASGAGGGGAGGGGAGSGAGTTTRATDDNDSGTVELSWV